MPDSTLLSRYHSSPDPRRRIREIFRLSQGKMKQGYDCIVVARTRAAHADYWELKRAFEKTCKKLDLWETQA